MDFLKKNTSSDDDEIFELTDIIEKGTEDAPASSSQNQAMETQMDNLFSKGNKAEQLVVPDDLDADLDALLADMQPSPAADSPTSPAPSAQKASSPSINVDEMLEMPNMSEVDALLKGLDIPPQPESTATASSTAPSGDDLDDLLNGLLDNPITPATNVSKPVTAESPAATEKASGMNLDDLDALFATPDVPGAEPEMVKTTSKPAPPRQKSAKNNQKLSLDEELDALLGVPGAASPPPDTADASDTADALLAAPAEKAAPVAHASFMDDLDDLLAAGSPTSEASSAADQMTVAPANTPPFQSIEDDLDAILGSVDAPSTPTSPTAAPAANMSVIINNEAEELVAAPPTSDDSTVEEPVDLSDLGSSEAATEDFLANVFDTPKSKPASSSSLPILEDDLLAGLDVQDGLDGLASPILPAEMQTFEKLEAMQSQEAAQDSSLAITLESQDVALVSASNMEDMPVMPASSPAYETDLPELDELDKLLAPKNAEESQPKTEDLPFSEQPKAHEGIGGDMSFEEKFSDEDIARAAQELLDDKVRAEASLDNVDTDAWLSSLDEILDESDVVTENSAQKNGCDSTINLPEQGDSVNLDSLLSCLPDSAEPAHYVYSPTRQAAQNALRNNSDAASLPQRATHHDNTACCFEQNYTQELTRLQHITERFASSLANADARIATLTQNAKSEVALDAMFRTDSPFNSSLQHAVRTAVATELRAHNLAESPAPASIQNHPDFDAMQAETLALQEKVHILETSLHSLQETILPLKPSLRDTQERISALEDGNKEARLQTVETRLEGQAEIILALEERCRLLETRLAEQMHSQAALEERFQHEVEKAAAAAAARIIREEIAGILAGQ